MIDTGMFLALLGMLMPRYRPKQPPPITFTWVTQSVAGFNSTQNTWTNANIGTAAADRLVIVTVAGRGNGGGSRQISAVSIGGVAATLICRSTTTPNPTAIYARLVPTGATTTIVVTANSDLDSGIIGIATLTGYGNAAARAISTPPPVNAQADLEVPALSVQRGGVAIYVASAQGSTTMTWTGADRQMVLASGTVLRGSAAAYIPAQNEPAYSATVTLNAAAGTFSACGAVWR